MRSRCWNAIRSDHAETDSSTGGDPLEPGLSSWRPSADDRHLIEYPVYLTRSDSDGTPALQDREEERRAGYVGTRWLVM